MADDDAFFQAELLSETFNILKKSIKSQLSLRSFCKPSIINEMQSEEFTKVLRKTSRIINRAANNYNVWAGAFSTVF